MINLNDLDKELNKPIDFGGALMDKLSTAPSYFRVAIKLFAMHRATVKQLQKYFDLSPNMLRVILEYFVHTGYIGKSSNSRFQEKIYSIKRNEEFEAIIIYSKEKIDRINKQNEVKNEKANRTIKSEEKTTQRNDEKNQ